MVLGVPARSRFASLTLGHLRRESIAAAFLVFSMAVTDYGIPLAVGGKVKTLATVLYASVAGQQQFGKGCIIGVCLLIPALLAFLNILKAVENTLRRNEHARPAAKRRIIHTPVFIFRIIAEIVQRDANMPSLQRSLANAGPQEGFKHLGKNAEDMEINHRHKPHSGAFDPQPSSLPEYPSAQ